MSTSTIAARMRSQTPIVAILAAVLAFSGLVASPLVAEAAAGTSQLKAGERLTAGQTLKSPNGRFTLNMQADGNLVLYAPGSKALWSSKTNGNPGASAAMQSDGNLVVYSSTGTALWHTRSNGSGANRIQLQDDGNLVMYTSTNAVVWHTDTRWFPSRLDAGTTITPGFGLQSPDGRYTALLKSDGSFILTGPQGFMWSAGIFGADRLVLQGDGNLVLYAGSQAKWNTATTGTKKATFLQLQNDGNLVLYNATSQAVWHTATCAGCNPPPAPTDTWVRPAAGQVSSEYGWRIHPIYRDLRFHSGIDFNDTCNRPILAASAGTVTGLGFDSSGNGFINVAHTGGVSTRYLHMESNGFLVQRGQTVAVGQEIAKVGSSGVSTACHLHFEVLVGNETTDPRRFLAERGIEL